MITRFGHRGAKGYEPENTLLSFQKAIDLNVDYIELDVFKCKTGEIVIIHDTKVDRTTNGTGYVEDMTFDELRSLDAGKGQTIPSLQEALDLIDRKVKVNIELKGSNSAKDVFKILTTYIDKKNWHIDDFLISSFDHYELRAFSEFGLKCKIGAIVAGIPIGYAAFAEELNAYSIHLSKEFINQSFVDDARQRGLKVFVYTLNEHKDIEKIKAFGIDGIFSNYPDRI